VSVTSSAPAFCALCADDAPGIVLVRRPLGRNDAMVSVCKDCDEEPPRAVHGPERGYAVPAPDPGQGRTLSRFATAANRITGEQRSRPRANIRTLQPGWKLVRVRILRPDGTKIDSQSAWDSLRGKPWFGELRLLGSDTTWHLFERPDDQAAAAARRGDSLSVALAGLEKFRAVGGDITPAGLTVAEPRIEQARELAGKEAQ